MGELGDGCLIGLDYGSEFARAVVVDADTGEVLATRAHPYRHGILTSALPDGTALPPGFALQVADDYEEAAAALLAALGRGRRVRGIGLCFTASSPLPATADGTPMSRLRPAEPHSYVKLWKHAAAQAQADRIGTAGDARLADVGGRLSANSLLAKAAELAEAAPAVWAEADRFIEAADWLAWRLTGREARSAAFAAYKACWSPSSGYPSDLVADFGAKLGPVLPVGAGVGVLSPEWRARTGILGEAVLAVPVIDSHAAVPAAGATRPGTLVGALGTSAAWLLLDGTGRPLPPGIEGRALGGVIPGLWCHEAGQAAFGDALGWFVRAFPRGASPAESFAAYEAEARALPPGQGRVVALDWWGGNRVPHGDATLSGLFAGLTPATTGADLYRALVESLCFGARAIVDLFAAGGLPVERVVAASGLSLASPLLVQTLADVLGLPVRVPRQAELTALGAAIHAAVACGLAPDYAEAARRYGARDAAEVRPRPGAHAAYGRLYGAYRTLAGSPATRDALRALR